MFLLLISRPFVPAFEASLFCTESVFFLCILACLCNNKSNESLDKLQFMSLSYAGIFCATTQESADCIYVDIQSGKKRPIE